MRHLKSGRKLSRRKPHRNAMLANLAASIILNGRVKTTDAKAKEVRPFIERMITFAKRGDLHARRIVLARLKDAVAVKKLFDEVGPQYVNRFGGYTRIVKLGFRRGDNSPVSLIELVKDEDVKKETKKGKPSKPGAKAQPALSKTPEESGETVEKEEGIEAAEVIPEKAEKVTEVKAEETEEKLAEDARAEEVKDESPAENEEAPPTAETKAESDEKSVSAGESGDEIEKSADEKSDSGEEAK